MTAWQDVAPCQNSFKVYLVYNNESETKNMKRVYIPLRVLDRLSWLHRHYATEDMVIVETNFVMSDIMVQHIFGVLWPTASPDSAS